ncbi:uncharacterized protein LOC124866392 isoform X2 [Girardinichthys multiradiatus]|uniref:uncharacterized protein LOC124866392 isoform X2 n=1 Tax=Girardinichthys multiradiatus TaxID=208333 RepID=UPI001FAE37B1|nr:uncharacterized protein LOC124866392 isoform X2 [Girardinichthys multiradiatus]
MTSSLGNVWVCIFFLIYWSTCFLPVNAVHQLRALLGCRVLIPCHDRSADSDSFKWFYKENELSKGTQLYFQNKNGVKHYDTGRPKVDIMPNRSLSINKFTDKDQGTYWCENCLQDVCKSNLSNFTTVKREILKEIQKAFYIISGRSFTHQCPGEFSNLNWTFEATNMNKRKLEQRSKMVTLNTSKILHIEHVTNTNSGKYTCWASICGGPSQKLITINLCVITDTSSLLMRNRTISVDEDPSGWLICNLSLNLDGHITTTGIYTSLAALNTTVGVSEKIDYFMPVIYGVSVALTFFILLGILTFYLKSRIQAAFPFHLARCFTGEAEEESTVIYGSVIIRTPPKTRNQHTYVSDCIYSELKV